MTTSRTRSAPRRAARRFAVFASTAVFAAVLLVVSPPGEAHAAGSEDLIVFDDDSSCEVRMQNVHISATVPGDVSVAVDVRCHPPGSPRGDLVVDEIAGQTTIAFSKNPPIPVFVEPDEIGTCERIAFANRPSATVPCHQVGGARAGYYRGTSTVTVTLRGQTEEVRVSKQEFLDGFV